MDTIFTGMEGMGIGEGQRRLMEVVMTTYAREGDFVNTRESL